MYLLSDKHKYTGIVEPDCTRITGTRLQNGKDACNFTFTRK